MGESQAMLDKTVPYKNIVMRLPGRNIKAIPEPALPKGFAFRLFQEGDEIHWARIETSVLEFDFESDAKAYFVRDYLPYAEELKRRCVFVVNSEGLPVATANAWFANSKLGYQASLHWVGVCPEYQGIGLGKAVIQKALRIFASVDPTCDVLLHTQTWSHVAVRIYHSLGFHMLKADRIAVMSNGDKGTRIPQNDYAEAMEVLKGVLDESTYRALASSSK